jgi:DNA-binding MarR family transcriptional regulator
MGLRPGPDTIIGGTMSKDAKDLKQLFLQKKPCSILLAASRLDKPYVSTLMKEADTTFAHTTNLLSDMEAYGLIEFVSEGRVKYVKLTRFGKELVRSLRSVDGLLDGKHLFIKISNLEKSMDRLDENIKSGITDEKSINARKKRLDAIGEKAAAIEAESAKYNNEALRSMIARQKERLGYMHIKMQKHETTPQDTLKPWLDT